MAGKSVILIVDPEETARRALCAVIRSDDYELIEYSDAHEALARLGILSESFDLIITEYLMPEMNGLDFLRQARALRPDALRIMLTGHADLDIAVAAINEAAVYRFLLKPWDAFDLRVMVKLALHHLASLRYTERMARQAR